MEKGDRKDSFFWVGELNGQTPSSMKHRRKLKSKKLEFVGWGSKSLIEFLQHIGKETSKELSQHEVTTIIHDYVHSFNLLHPVKKKRVVCDERLQSLFGKKSIPRIKIHELLNSHFANNRDSSEDDYLYSSEEYEDANITCKKRKVSNSEEKTHSQKNNILLSHFAAIIPENIKLLYLKRSLVQELLKQPESFEGKLLGSYIRIKSDPMDFSQKNSHQLHLVTGVKNVPGNGGPEEVLLQVPNMVKDIPIRMLSDDDFSKEEVEDLSQRVKDGLVKRPTVVEVEQKARILHEDITRHWLPRELVYLQNLIDRANDKGWRKELFEYLERKKRLQTPSELSKLLTEVPKVIADKLEPESTAPQEQLQDSPISVHEDVPHLTNDLGTDQALPSNAEVDELVVLDGFNKANTKPTEKAGSGQRTTSFQWVEDKKIPEARTSGQLLDSSDVLDGFDKASTKLTVNVGSGEHITSFQWVEDKKITEARTLGQPVDLSTAFDGFDKANTKPTENAGSEEHLTSYQRVEVKKIAETKTSGQPVDLLNVIELSDDEEQVDEQKAHKQEDAYELSRPIWFYLDPQGEMQGPFSSIDLKRWSDAGYFSPDFKVWKDGETPDRAILLTDMLSIVADFSWL